jgi:23S rRNA (pseudouridine1915-N3)-methyltransferase
MKIKLWFFGKKKEITDFEKEMAKRIGFRCEFEMIPLSQAGINDSSIAKKMEAEKLLNKISDQDFVVIFDERGQELDSVEFSQKLKSWIVARGTVHFVIGGAHGHDEKIRERADMLLRFGKMVWTRNLFRQMACEQIYRAMEIDAGSNFHKK